MAVTIWTPCASSESANSSQCADIRDYGALGNGSEDDTGAIQNCIDENNCVYIPEAPTHFLVSNLDLKANLTIRGAGPGLAKLYQGAATGLKGLFYVDSGSASTTVDNIEITGLDILGRVEADGFWEFYHLVTLHGVKNVKIHWNNIRGFQGDGVYLGTSNTAGVERHNYDVHIYNNLFDGITKNNRNAITIIDGERIHIHHNHFTRCTKNTMPGAVDIEPNNYSFHYIKNISVCDNTFYDNGGNVGNIAFVGGDATTRPTNIIVARNQFQDSVTSTAHADVAVVFTGVQVDNDTPNMNIVISDNVGYNGSNPFEIRGVKGVKVHHNQFYNYASNAVVGFSADTDYVHNIAISNNNFHKCGNVSNQAIAVFKAERLTFADNLFDDCGAGNVSSSGILLTDTGVTRGIRSYRNIFRSPSDITRYAYRKAVGHVSADTTNVQLNDSFYGGPTYDLASELLAVESNNQLLAYEPTVAGGTTPGAPTYTVQYGAYRREGNIVYVYGYVAWSILGSASGNLNISLPLTAFPRTSNPVIPNGSVIVSGGTGFTVGNKSFVPYLNDQQVVGSVTGAIRIAVTDGVAAPAALAIAANMTVWFEVAYAVGSDIYVE